MLIKQWGLDWDWAFEENNFIAVIFDWGKLIFNGFSEMGKEWLVSSTILWTDVQGLYFFISFSTKCLVFQFVFPFQTLFFKKLQIRRDYSAR